MRIAYFSPFPPQATGIARYSANLLPHLARLAEVTLFTNDPEAISDLGRCFSVRHLDGFDGPLRERFDMCVYQMGNNVSFHADIYATLLRYPGITALHDANLNSFYGELLMKRREVSAYTREMAYAYGAAGARHARRAHRGLEEYNVQRYPLIKRVSDISLGVIVHSRYAQQIVAERCPDTPVTHINQPVPVTSDLMTGKEAKVRLGFKADDLVLASFGYIAPSKRIDVALRAFAEIRRCYPNVYYALVGKVVEGFDLSSLVNELDLDDAVRTVGYVDEDTFQAYLAATDIGINLRYPTSGETSATMLALMAADKPTLVSRVDAFVELPDVTCVKIDVGPNEQSQVEEVLQHLIEDRDMRRQIGTNAADYIRRECDPQAIAAEYIDFIQQLLRSIRANVLKHFQC